MSDHREDHGDRHSAGGPDPLTGNLDVTLDGLSDVDTTGVLDGEALVFDSGTGLWVPASAGVTDHGALTGLADDDHTQYTRKDTLTTRGDLYYRDASGVVRKAVGSTGQYLGSDGTDALWRAQSTLDHGSIGGLSDDDHTQYSLKTGRVGALVRRTANQSFPNATDTRVTFNTTDLDTNSFLSGSPVNRFTVPTSLAGIYAVTFRGSVSSDPTVGFGTNVIIWKGSGASSYDEWWAGVATFYGDDVTANMACRYCAVGDWFEVWITNSTGGSWNLNPARLEIYRMTSG